MGDSLGREHEQGLRARSGASKRRQGGHEERIASCSLHVGPSSGANVTSGFPNEPLAATDERADDDQTVTPTDRSFLRISMSF